MSPLGLSTGAAAALAVLTTSIPLRTGEPHRAVTPRPGDDVMPVPMRPRRIALIAASVVVAMSGVLLVGPGLMVIVACVIAVAAATRQRRTKRMALLAIEAAMPDAIELLVMCLHSGSSPAQSIAQLTREAPPPLRPAFDAVEQRLHRGAGFAEALGALTSSCGRCALPLVAAMSAAVRDGLPLAPVLDRLTDEAVDARRRHGEAAARRLPVRLSFPLVVCTLPSFVLLAIAPAVLGAISSLQGSAP